MPVTQRKLYDILLFLFCLSLLHMLTNECINWDHLHDSSHLKFNLDQFVVHNNNITSSSSSTSETALTNNNNEYMYNETNVEQTQKVRNTKQQKFQFVDEQQNNNRLFTDLINRLKKADVNVTELVLKKLPLRSEVESMYGDEPVVIGLDKCKEFQQNVDPPEAFIAPAGMFNTGTNLMAEFLIANCVLHKKQEKYGEMFAGMRWQVPWGKHSPASWRGKHIAQSYENANPPVIQENFLPVITIKDPYTWMQSMCRHKYSAHFNSEGHCPKLVKEDGASNHVSVLYSRKNVTHHDTLAEVWNDYYTAYYNSAFPALIVRYEDLLFHVEKVVEQVCLCAGGRMKEKFTYITGSAKGDKGIHSGSSGLVEAMIRYGNSSKRLDGFHEKDLEYAHSYLDPTLMDVFAYAPAN